MTNDGINTLVYDAENHVTSATSGSGSGAYTYDGSGQRVKKIGGGNTIVTIFAGAQVLAEYYNGAAPSSPTNEYIYAGSLRVASIQAGATNYWHNDHLSPRVRTDTSGNVSDQRATFPFGETWYSPGASPSMFTSYYRDYEAAGDDYAQARTYVGGLGRFSSPDPVSGSTSDPQSLNRYSYVRNMPIQLTDPFGTCPGGTAQNRDDSQSQNAQGSGPSPSDSADSSDPDPQQGPPPWNGCKGFTDQGSGSGALGGDFGGGGVSIDGGETFDPGDGGWGITGIGTDPFSILNAAFAVTGYETVDNPDCLNGDCPGGVGEETISVPVYGNLGLLSLLGGPGGTIPLAYLGQAKTYLKTFKTTSTNCQKDLNAVSLTPENVQNLAGTVKLVNGLQNPTVAASMGTADFVVSNAAPSPTLIYNPNNFWQTSFSQLLGTLVHEFAHIQNPGPSGEDAALISALKINNATNTNAISLKFAADCFPGVKAP